MFLGVDGGGTKCRMRLANQNLKTIGEAVIEAPSNLQVGNGDAAYAAINRLTEMVFSAADINIKETKNTHACFGMAGARLLSSRQSFAARSFPFASLNVVDDIDIARAGAHLGADGAVLIIGTGSAGLAEVAGERHQVGGWGFLIGDPMSGAWLGRKLLRKSLLAFEGIEKPSPLSLAVMEKFENDPQNLMAWSFSNPQALAGIDSSLLQKHVSADLSQIVHARPGDYGSFVPMIFDFFEQGDILAKQLIDLELETIDLHVQWFLARDAKSIAIVGGLGQRLFAMLEKAYPGLIVKPKASPLCGALILSTRSKSTDS